MKKMFWFAVCLLGLAVCGCGDDSGESGKIAAQDGCGNGSVETGELCDDGNTASGDGCSADCSAVEEGYECPPSGGACTKANPAPKEAECGNGSLEGDEKCDDGNTASGDGCSADCSAVEEGYECPPSGGACTKANPAPKEAECGNGSLEGDEKCDDGNTASGDGCSADCSAVEEGYECPPAGGACTKANPEPKDAVCGNGTLEGDENCDDGNTASGDGCSADCSTVEEGYECPLSGGACTKKQAPKPDEPACGNGILEEGEVCDKTEGVGEHGKCADDCSHVYVQYSEFGAVGDGKTNDMAAIAAAHKYANENHLMVRGDEGFTYYIPEIEESAIIKTDTDWTGSTFYIDDNKLKDCKSTDPNEQCQKHIFIVKSSYDEVCLLSSDSKKCPHELKSLKGSQKKIDITLEHDSLILVKDSNHLHYRLKEGKMVQGHPRQELFIVDKNGNVDMSAPIHWTYDTVTEATAYPMDEEKITITGGTFITNVYQKKSSYYFFRNLYINRSNVVIDGIVHQLEGEQVKDCADYDGFLQIEYCANVLVKNSSFSSRISYGLGSYGILPQYVVNLTFEHCNEVTNILDKTRWGLIGSNYCKNFTLDHCEFSRFDAHRELMNANVRHSTIGNHGMTVMGYGQFNVEDSTIYGEDSFIYMRYDYGSTWDGVISIKNSKWIPAGDSNKQAYILKGSFSGDNKFGYGCRMPNTMNIDGLTVMDKANGIKTVYLFNDITPKNTSSSFKYSNSYKIIEKVNISNYKSQSGDKWQLSPNKYMFNNVAVSVK